MDALSNDSDGDTMPASTSFYLLAGLARISLIQGQFNRTQLLVNSLKQFADEHRSIQARAHALTYQGMLAVIAHDDSRAAIRCFCAGRAPVNLPVLDALILRGLTVASHGLSQSDAVTHFAAALRSSSGGFGVIDILLAALLEASDDPDRSIQYMSLSWHHALPDGGWLTHSPVFRRAADHLQQQTGVERYRQAWMTGQRLSVRTVLQDIITRYTA